MSAFRCQICGRRKRLRKNGSLVHHCVGGPRCPGSGHPPIENEDAWLIAYGARVDAAYQRVYAAVRALEEARANWIDPALIVRRGALAGQSLRIEKRLKRHREWPERYRRSIARQMEHHGYTWADSPPEYLVERDGRACGASGAVVDALPTNLRCSNIPTSNDLGFVS